MNSEKQKDLIRLQHWYHGSPGKLFAEMEHEILEEFLAQVFGYYIVAFRLLSECDFLSSSAIQNRYYLRWVQCSSLRGADVVAQPDTSTRSASNTVRNSCSFMIAVCFYSSFCSLERTSRQARAVW